MKRIYSFLIVIVLLLSGCTNRQPAIQPRITATPSVTSAATITTTVMPTQTPYNDKTLAELEVHFIDVGQGDSTLIVCDGETLLIDAGDNNKGTTVQLYLQKQGITELDYVIGTHPHADHIGGLDDVIEAFDIGKIFMPKVQNNTKTFEDVLDAISEKKLKL